MKFNDIARKLASSFTGRKQFIITDSNVRKYYGNTLLKLLKEAGVSASLISFPAGESSKTRATKNKIEDQLLALKAGRDSVMIGLGGGVVGDITGFVASNLHRGVTFVQIPTTLLAQVDSSIGGKVAVNHPQGKNLIGAFYQPHAVYIDPQTLKTLPDKELSNGMAEVIKYAAILDLRLFEYLMLESEKILQRDKTALTKIIRRCCELKRSVVEKDEREKNLRRILNFGHTIGHALERASNYTLSHGEAVAIGMLAETKISIEKGLLEPDAFLCMEYILQLYSLPTEIPKAMPIKTLFQLTSGDKKAKDGVVYYTLLEELGKARVGIPLSSKEAYTLYNQ